MVLADSAVGDCHAGRKFAVWFFGCPSRTTRLERNFFYLAAICLAVLLGDYRAGAVGVNDRNSHLIDGAEVD